MRETAASVCLPGGKKKPGTLGNVTGQGFLPRRDCTQVSCLWRGQIAEQRVFVGKQRHNQNHCKREICWYNELQSRGGDYGGIGSAVTALRMQKHLYYVMPESGEQAKTVTAPV